MHKRTPGMASFSLNIDIDVFLSFSPLLFFLFDTQSCVCIAAAGSVLGA